MFGMISSPEIPLYEYTNMYIYMFIYYMNVRYVVREAETHCKKQVKIMKNRGIKILSYFVADFAYGPRMDTYNPGNVVNEAYMYWNVSEKAMLMMGRFNSWMGYERLSAANNFHYSMSHMFTYSPRNFNGLVAQFDLGSYFGAILGSKFVTILVFGRLLAYFLDPVFGRFFRNQQLGCRRSHKPQ